MKKKANGAPVYSSVRHFASFQQLNLTRQTTHFRIEFTEQKFLAYSFSLCLCLFLCVLLVRLSCVQHNSICVWFIQFCCNLFNFVLILCLNLVTIKIHFFCLFICVQDQVKCAYAEKDIKLRTYTHIHFQIFVEKIWNFAFCSHVATSSLDCRCYCLQQVTNFTNQTK